MHLLVFPPESLHLHRATRRRCCVFVRKVLQPGNHQQSAEKCEFKISQTIPTLFILAIIKLLHYYDTSFSIFYSYHPGVEASLKQDKYKDVIIDSPRFLVKEKRVEVNVFTLMSNHIHLIWQIQNGHEREAVQRDFLKFVSQTIIRNLKINHPAVLEKFYVEAKDRKYQIWERNPLSIDLWTKEMFIQKMEYIHYNPVAAGLCIIRKNINIPRRSFYDTGEDEFGILTHWMA